MGKRKPSVVEIEYHPKTPLKVSRTVTRRVTLPFSTLFSVETINAPRYGKVKMPTVDLYDGTRDPKEHSRVYKVQMYVQDVDNTAYRHCDRGLTAYPREVSLVSKIWLINSSANSSQVRRKAGPASTFLRSSRGCRSPSSNLSSASTRRRSSSWIWKMGWRVPPS